MAEPSSAPEGLGFRPESGQGVTVPLSLAAPLLGKSRLYGPGNTSRSLRRAAERRARRERGKGTPGFGGP